MVAEFTPDVADVKIDAAVERWKRPAEGGLCEFLAPYNATCISKQELKKFEFGGGEVHRFSRTEHGSRRRVHLNISGRNTMGRLGTSRNAELNASKDGTKPGDQFAGIEGFGNVIIGAYFKSDDSIHLLGAGGRDNYGDLRCRAHPSKKLKAIKSREHDIEYDDCVVSGESAVQPLEGIVNHLEA
jgi:hypothetical protein